MRKKPAFKIKFKNKKLLALLCMLPIIVLLINPVVRSYNLTSKSPAILEINENHDSGPKEKESKEKVNNNDWIICCNSWLPHRQLIKSSNTLSFLSYKLPYIEIISPPPEHS